MESGKVKIKIKGKIRKAEIVDSGKQKVESRKQKDQDHKDQSINCEGRKEKKDQGRMERGKAGSVWNRLVE